MTVELVGLCIMFVVGFIVGVQTGSKERDRLRRRVDFQTRLLARLQKPVKTGPVRRSHRPSRGDETQIIPTQRDSDDE